MSIDTLAALQQKLRRPLQRFDVAKLTGWPAGTHPNSTWTDSGTYGPGVAPTTAAVPTRSTTGALGQKNKSASNLLRAVLRRAQVVSTGNPANLNSSFIVLADRLSHQGGLSGTTTGAQTTNLPTAALTRYTSGVGVWGALEIYTTIGGSGSTVTASYTNSDGTASRTTQAMEFGQTNFNGARTLVPMMVQLGDRGIRSVESVTLSGSTGTAGNFGVTLFKTLLAMPAAVLAAMPRDGAPLPWLGGIAQIEDDACLQLITYGSGTVTVDAMASIDMFED